MTTQQAQYDNLQALTQARLAKLTQLVAEHAKAQAANPGSYAANGDLTYVSGILGELIDFLES